MKKKLLFVIPSVEGGGAEKSLVTLLSSIDFNEYSVDLQLFSKKGLFIDSIPSEVNVLDEPKVIDTFMLPLRQSLASLWTMNKRLMIYRIIYSLKQKLSRNKLVNRQKAWNYLNRSIKSINKRYDAAIGYLEMWPIYFVVDKVDADIKIGYIHTDYLKYGMDKRYDNPYFDNLDYILSVSDNCKSTLASTFPHFKSKLELLENITSKDILEKMSCIGQEFGDSFNGTRILTIGRLDYNKGHDLAIKCCAKLVENGHNIRWYVIGDGSQKQEFIQMVAQYGIEKHFIFLGTTSNPYSYLKQADIYVHPSRIEGKSIAIEEAKILCKPIVVTAYSTVKDQIIDGEDGIIIDIDEDSLYEGVSRVIKNKQLRHQLILGLQQKDFSNKEKVISKFYRLVNNEN